MLKKKATLIAEINLGKSDFSKLTSAADFKTRLTEFTNNLEEQFLNGRQRVQVKVLEVSFFFNSCNIANFLLVFFVFL